MKKYLIQLIKADFLRERVKRDTAARMLAQKPGDSFWLRKKQSAENNILKIERYLEKIESLDTVKL